MRPTVAGVVAVALGAAWPTSAPAQPAPADRPSEQDMFGAPAAPAKPPESGAQSPAPPAPAAPAPAAPAPSAPAAPGGGNARDDLVLGAATGEEQHLSDYIAPDNPLQIGGQLYLRAQTSAPQGQAPDAWSFSAPSLLDAYFDARPNPRVRAFVLGRMGFDPTRLPNQTGGTTSGAGGALAGGSATGFSTFSATRGPTTILDQMWIRFDVEQRVFVTAGKQHTRWGTGRFWQPTDYLHPVKRNPLDVFDARAGTTMLKLHLPWEERAWNFYAFGVFEDPNTSTPTLRRIAGAVRAELVIADFELGLDAYLQRDHDPRYGVDLSTGIWDFDVYADVGFRPGADFQHLFYDEAGRPFISPFTGYEVQAVGGVSYAHKYNDNDLWTVGLEYFYNHAGYDGAQVYPDLITTAASSPATAMNPLSLFPFFYIGRHYGAVFASFPAPYSWNYTTFTVSTLGNLSDRSFLSRLDTSVTILTHLSLEAFVGVHYGHGGGELRFKLPDALAASFAAASATPVPNAYPLLDLGVALRLKI